MMDPWSGSNKSHDAFHQHGFPASAGTNDEITFSGLKRCGYIIDDYFSTKSFPDIFYFDHGADSNEKCLPFFHKSNAAST